MISFHAIFARKHGEANGYAVLAAFDEIGRVAVYAKFEELRGPSGSDFRADHAEVQLINNLDIETEWKFPDPKTVEAERKARALAEARTIRAKNEEAQRKLDEAKGAVEDASSAMEDLTDEQKALLAEADAAEKNAAEQKAKEEADAQAAADLAAEERAKSDKAQSETAEKSVASGTAALAGAAPEQSPGPAPAETSTTP